MTNMINKVEKADRYTYLFQGNSQVLDHIIVSNNLVDHTEVDILHINADFTDMAGRASDHDPVMDQIDLSGEGAAAPIKVKKTYNLTNYKAKKLTLSSPSIALHLDGNSEIKEGITINRSVLYAELMGEGLKDTTVIVKPSKKGTVLDFTGTEVKKLIVDGPNLKEIRGAGKISKIEYRNVANPDSIKITK